MNRAIGAIGAMLLGLLILAPVALAADPVERSDQFIFNSGGDIDLPVGQVAGVVVVADGSATVHGDARTIVVLQGTVHLVGARTRDIVSIGSHVTIDGTSVVTGDIRAMDSVIDQAAGSSVEGRVLDGIDLAALAWILGSALFLAYIGFAIAAIVAALALAAIAARQVRSAEALLQAEPGMSLVAALAGFIGILVAGTVAIVTIVGIPLGLGILAFVLPALAIVGYLVAGISLGDWIVARLTPGVRRDRPYLAAIVGVLALDVVSVVPPIGGIACLFGVGAVVLLIWRTFRGSMPGEPAAIRPAVAVSAG